MRRKKLDIILLSASIVCFFITASVFLIIPLKVSDSYESMFNILIPSVFWLFTLIGIVIQIILAKRRREWIISNRLEKSPNFMGRIGLISPMKNLYGSIADIVFLISVIGFIISMILTDSRGYACYVSLAGMIFAFSMHCIFNGRIFFYIQNQYASAPSREEQYNKNKRSSKHG